MANNFIKKITPLNSDVTYTINDPILNEVIIGTQTASTGSWTGKSNTINGLYTGLQIRYYLPYAGSGNATLNLTLADNTTTGAINCYFTPTSRLTTHYPAGSTITMTYYPAGTIKISGTATTDNRWICDADYDANTVSQVRWDYSTFTAGADKVYPYTLMMMNTGGNYESIVTSASQGTSKARNTHGFVPGRLALYYSSGTTNAGATQTTSYYSVFEAYSNADGRYSFNISTTGLNGAKPLYLVGTITDGLFYLDATWWTQTLPTTDSEKIYMYVGSVYNTGGADYRFNLAPYHPMYWHQNGNLQLYGGDVTKAYVDNLLAANDAMIFKGLIAGTSTSPGAFTPGASCGDTYKVSTAGYINGEKVEVGDMLICVADGTHPATASGADVYTTIKQNWVIIQNNIDGAVTGPASATNNHVAIFDGTTGKIIKDSGFTLGKSVPADALFTDTDNKTAQIPTTTDANYEILFSGTADNTSRTEGARKNSNLLFNPSTGQLSTTTVKIGDGVVLEYNSTTKSLDFIFV